MPGGRGGEPAGPPPEFSCWAQHTNFFPVISGKNGEGGRGNNTGTMSDQRSRSGGVFFLAELLGTALRRLWQSDSAARATGTPPLPARHSLSCWPPLPLPVPPPLSALLLSTRFGTPVYEHANRWAAASVQFLLCPTEGADGRGRGWLTLTRPQCQSKPRACAWLVAVRGFRLKERVLGSALGRQCLEPRGPRRSDPRGHGFSARTLQQSSRWEAIT